MTCDRCGKIDWLLTKEYGDFIIEYCSMCGSTWCTEKKEKDMRKFEECPSCPKCKHEGTDITYDEGYLRVWCKRCFYTWKMKCADES